MKKLHNTIPLSLLLAGAFASQIGCVDAADSLRILNNQEPQEGCQTTNADTGNFISFGRIDVAADFGYLFTPVVENRTRGSDLTDRVAFVSGAVVNLELPDGVTEPAQSNLISFRQPFSGSIESGGTATFAFELISKDLLDHLAPQIGDGEVVRIFAEVEMKAEIDGSEVSSPIFTYPIEVSNGLIYENLGSCDALPDIEFDEGGTCQPLQDGFAHCCDGADGLVCTDLVPATTEETL